jgi:hypothetical protein
MDSNTNEIIDEINNDETIDEICWKCGSAPCEWLKWGAELQAQGEEFKNVSSQDAIPNSKIRKCMYRYVILILW